MKLKTLLLKTKFKLTKKKVKSKINQLILYLSRKLINCD